MSFLKKIERGISNIIPHVHSKEKRAAMQATAEQISYYQQAKKDLTEAKTNAENEKKTAQGKINEKMIRAKQRLYKRGGFLQEPNTSAPQEQLG